MDFSEGCSEVDFILEHLNPEEKEKLPDKVFSFFRDNKSIFYKVNLSTDKPLKEQNLKEETKILLKIIHYKYFANNEQKKEFKELLKSYNEINVYYNKDEIKNDFRDNSLIDIDNTTEEKNTELIEIKENKIKVFFMKIINWIKKKND